MPMRKPLKSGMTPLSAGILALLCGILGIGFLWWTSSQVWYVYASTTWERTQGTIWQSEYIDNGPRKDGEARIRYTYVADGHMYEGDHLLPGTLVYIDAVEEQKVQEYRPGMTTTVYYDPQNPQASSLEHGTATRLTYIGLLLGMLFTSGTIYILQRLIRGQPVRL